MLATIRRRLFLLVLIVAIPLIAANLFVINRLATAQSEAQKETLVGTTRALAAAVDAELRKYAVLGYSLATFFTSEDENLERFQTHASEAVKNLPGAWVIVADVPGQQLLNTLRPFGDQLPHVVPREVHQRAFESGTDQIGGVQIGPVAQRLALSVFIPVFRDGRPRFNIVIGLDAGVFFKVLESQQLPKGWVAGIGDRDGNFIARSIDNDRYVGKRISSGWLEASQHSDEGYIENVSMEGTLLVSAFSNLKRSSWTVSIGASKAILSSPARSSLYTVMLVSLSLVLLSLALVWYAARSIVQSMQSLEVASSALLRNEPTKLKRTGLLEVDHALSAFESAATSILERERRHALLVDELNHRVKNTLAVVQSMAILAQNSATTVKEFTTSFVSRVVSLAHTHDLLTESSWGTVDLKQVFQNELSSYQDANQTRIVMHGSTISLNAKDAVAVSMIVHELATNAAKYGALSSATGKLKIVWVESADKQISIDWQEVDGPPVQHPSRKSFGSKLIKSLVGGLAGTAVSDFSPHGLHFSMSFLKSAEFD